MSKSGAYVFAMCAIIGIFLACVGLLLIGKIDPALLPVGVCLASVCTISGGFIGFQVANNGVKGKWFNAGLVEKEEQKE